MKLAFGGGHTGYANLGLASPSLVSGRTDVLTSSSIAPHLGTFATYGCGALLAGTLVAQHLEALIWVPVAAVVLALGPSELSGKLERSTR